MDKRAFSRSMTIQRGAVDLMDSAVEAAYDRTRERIRIADYRLDKALDELK